MERELAIGEPVLTADELRALLQEQPSLPPSDSSLQVPVLPSVGPSVSLPYGS